MSFTQVELERKLLCCRLHYVCERLIIGIGLIKLSDIVFEWKGFSNRIRSRTRKRGKRKHSAIETRTQNKGSSKKYLWNYFPIKMTFEQRQKSHSSCNAVDLNSLSENWRLYRFPAPDRNAVARQRQIWKKKQICGAPHYAFPHFVGRASELFSVFEMWHFLRTPGFCCSHKY